MDLILSVHSDKAHSLYGDAVYGNRLRIIIHINTRAVIVAGVVNILFNSVMVSNSRIAQVGKDRCGSFILTLSVNPNFS